MTKTTSVSLDQQQMEDETRGSISCAPKSNANLRFISLFSLKTTNFVYLLSKYFRDEYLVLRNIKEPKTTVEIIEPTDSAENDSPSPSVKPILKKGDVTL